MSFIKDIRVLHKMNQDVSPESLKEEEVVSKENLRSGVKGFVCQKILDREEIWTSLPAGTNEVLGSCEDVKAGSIYYLLYNSSNYHSIIIYNIDGSYNYLVQHKFWLGLSPSHPIHSIDILNGFLYWTDNLNPPRYIDTTRALNGDYVPDAENTMVAKKPPEAPAVSYTDDSDQTYSNVVGKSVQFSIRYVYNDNTKSVWSVLTDPLLFDEDCDSGEYSDTQNNITINVGSTTKNDVKRVDIAVKEGDNSWYFVDYLEGSTGTYVYEGGKQYAVPDEEIYKQFDYVPRVARTQEVLSNDILSYANYVEGYDIEETDSSHSWSAEALSVSESVKTLSLKNTGKYKYGFVYFDAYNRSTGVCTKDSYVIDVPENDSTYTLFTLPSLKVQINHHAPSWATHYEIVFTKELNYKYFRQFALKNTEAISLTDSSGFILPEYVPYTPQKGDVIRLIYDNYSSYISNTHTTVTDFHESSRVVTTSDDVISIHINSAADKYLVCEIFSVNNENSDEMFYSVGCRYDVVNTCHKSNDISQTPPTSSYATVDITGVDTFKFRTKFKTINDTLTYSAKASTVDYNNEIYIPGDVTDFISVGDDVLCVGFNEVSGANGTHTLNYVSYTSTFNWTVLEWSGISITGTSDDSGNVIFTSEEYQLDPSIYVESKDYSYLNDIVFNPLGKAHIVIPEMQEKRYSNYLRHSNKYFENSAINGLSTFDAEDYSSVSSDFGEITLTEQVGITLKVLQEKRNSSIYVDRIIINSDGDDGMQFASANRVFGSIVPSDKAWGCAVPGSVVRADRHIYFFDPYTGEVLRDAANGMFPISRYGMRQTFSALGREMIANGLINYRVRAGVLREYGEYYLTVFNTLTQAGQTFVFHEDSNSWTYNYTYYPEGYCNIGDYNYHFDGGRFYQMEGATTYLPSSATFYSSAHPLQDKTFKVLTEDADEVWAVVDYDCEIPADAQRKEQKTRILEGRFEYKNGRLYANIPKNALSTGTTESQVDMVNGRPMVGRVIKFKISNNGTEYAELRNVEVLSQYNKIS